MTKKTTTKKLESPPAEKKSTEEPSTALSTEAPLSEDRLKRLHRVLGILLRELPELPVSRNEDHTDVTLSYVVAVRIGQEEYEFDNVIRLPGLLSEENRVDATEMLDHQLDLVTRPVKNLVMRRIQSEDIILSPMRDVTR